MDNGAALVSLPRQGIGHGFKTQDPLQRLNFDRTLSERNGRLCSTCTHTQIQTHKCVCVSAHARKICPTRSSDVNDVACAFFHFILFTLAISPLPGDRSPVSRGSPHFCSGICKGKTTLQPHVLTRRHARARSPAEHTSDSGAVACLCFRSLGANTTHRSCCGVPYMHHTRREKIKIKRSP